MAGITRGEDEIPPKGDGNGKAERSAAKIIRGTDEIPPRADGKGEAEKSATEKTHAI